jgi:hypothetical protein
MNTPQETYNPWSIVNLVFRHLVDEGLHPVLGETGDPGAPAAGLLRAFGITPAAEGSNHVSARAKSDLARLREAFEAGHFSADERLQRCHGAAARRAARRPRTAVSG